MNELLTERSGNILRVQFNRPAKKNAMTLAMYTGLADLLNEADKDENVNVVLLHGAGDSFTAGNDLEDFLKNPPCPGDWYPTNPVAQPVPYAIVPTTSGKTTAATIVRSASGPPRRNDTSPNPSLRDNRATIDEIAGVHMSRKISHP